MPDIFNNISANNNPEVPSEINIQKVNLDSPITGQIDLSQPVKSTGNPLLDMLGNIRADLSKQPWVQSEQYNYPLYKIPLKDAERFNNPAIGYDPFDPNLETKYGEAQGTVSRIFNRLVKTGAGVGVSILNAGKDIQDLFSGQSGVDDKFTTDTDNWLKRLDQVNLPNYKTQYQADHPVMSYFNPLHLTSFLDNWGGAGQALAPIAGAIATSVLTDIPLGIATDGIADNLLLPKQLSRIMEGVGDLSKGLTSSKEDFNAFTNLLNNSEDLSEGVRKALTLAKNFKYGANTGRYLASVGLSSYVQSMMMGNETYNEVKNDVLSQYKDEYGNVNASGDVVSRAEKTAKDAGDAVVAPAFAFMTISSAFGLSSILRPAQAAIDATEKALSKEASVVLNPNNINEFTVTSKQYGKGLMGLAQKSLNRSGFLVDNLRQAATMGGFYVSSDATKNYYEHKFSLNGTEDAMSLATYYMQSLGKLFTTPEGQEQLAIGFVGGALEHIAKGINNRVKGIDNSADAFAAKIAQGLNNYKATSLFDVSRDESISSADIVKQMQDAANSGDIFRYKNLQHTALFNFVSSGEKLHQFEARINQLEALKSLNKENFETLFNIDFNDANKKTVSEFVDATINKAKTIKEDIRKVNGAFAENPFSPKTQASDHLAYDHYKDEVAFAITKQKDFLKRAKQLKENSLNKVPAANFEDIVGLSSEEGVKGTVSNFEKKIEDLKNSEKLAGDNEDLKSGFKEERDFLEDKVKDLRGTLKKYDPDQYLITLRELYNYYGNGNSVKGNFDIHPIDVLSVFNNGQDAYNLAQGNKDIVRYYRELTGKTGFKNFKADFINHLTSYYDRITVNPDGTFKVKDLPVEEPVQNFVNDYLGVNTPVEAASKIDAGDKEFIAKVIDPNYEKSNDPNSLGNRIASGKEAITPELKDKAKLRVAEDFKNAPVPTNPTPPGTPTTKAQQRDEFTKQQMKDLGISVVEPSTDIETVYQDQDAAITTALLKPTSEQTEATDNTVQKLWKNMMSPIKLLNKIFSPKADDVPFNENIRQLLFSVPSVESFKDNLHAVITETPENFKTSKRTRVVGSKGLYRTSYELNITLYNGDKAIGLLHPPSSLEFKRGDSYHPISELKDANEYVDVTGNNIVSFDAFRKNVDAYQKAYDELVREHKGKKAGEPATTEVSNGKFLSLFSPYISYGSRFESDKETNSTAIKDLKYQGKGSAILSFPVVFNEETGEWARSAKPAILNLSELEGDESFHVLQFVDNNIDKFHQHDARYFYLSKLPNGKFEDISIIRARPAQESEKGVAQAYDIIKQAISHPEGADLKDVNQQLRESLYLSDRNTGKGKGSGKVKGNQMRLEINDNGDLQLNIFNTHNKIRKNVVIPKDIVLSTNNFDELVSLITKRLDDAKKTSHDLGERLRPILTKESFKKSILDDENAPLEQIKANLKASVLPEVFQDYTLELMPNSGIDKAIPAPAEKVTEPITPVAPEATVQPEVTPAPTGALSTDTGALTDETSALPEQPVEELQPIKVETTPAPQEEPAVQEPEAEQYVPQVKVPEPEVPIWKAPVPIIEGENKIKYISAIQNAYRNGSYDDAVRNGELNEGQLREIFKSAGLGDNTADRVIFRATNKGLQYSIDDIKEMTPDTSDNEFQMVSNYFLDSGKLEEAIKNDMIDPESAKNILDNTITTSTEVKTKKEALQKTVEDKLAEQEKQKKEAEQATKTAGEKLKAVSDSSYEGEKKVRAILQDIEKGLQTAKPLTDEQVNEKLDPLMENGSISYEKVFGKAPEKPGDLHNKGINNRLERGLYNFFKLPEAEGDAFGASQKKNRYTVVNVDDLIPTENYVRIDNVKKFLKNPYDVTYEDKPVIYEKDGKYYILDGHTRAAAAKLLGEKQIGVLLYQDDYTGETTFSTIEHFYNDAVRKGNNPELVKAVEDITGKNKIPEVKEEPIQDVQRTPTEKTLEQPKVSIHERPELENPVYKVEIGGKERFIQRQHNGDFNAWYEVTKDGNNWESSKFVLGDNKEEAVNNLLKDSSVEPVDKTEEERIAEANKRIEELKAQLAPERKWVKVSNDDGIRAEELPADLSNAERANLNSRRTSLVNISERLRKVFPDIPMDIIYAPDVEWKGRIKDGRVEINLHKATLDTPIHEMLHPFILALRNSNYELYSNLIDEMRFGHNGELAGYIDKVKADKDYANLKPEEAEEEALIRYLSDDMSSMLDANGQLNEKKVEEKYGNSAFQKVYTWVQDRIRDLWKAIVDAFNGTTSSGEQRSSSAKKKAIEKFKDLQYFTYNFEKGTLTAYTGDVSNQNTTKKITTEDGEEKSVQKKVEPNRSWRIATDLSEIGIQELKDKGFTDTTIKQLKDIINDYQSRPEAKKALKINKFALGEDAQKAPVKEEQQFKLPVSEIPVDFTLKNIADVIGMQQKLSFDLSSEQGAIDKLEAYQHADKIDFEEWKKKLQIRLAQLEDTSKRRIIDADIVQGNLIGVRRVLRDFDGVEALTQYVGQGIRGLNAGAWLVRDISETIKRANAGETAMYDDKGKRTWVKSNTKVLDEALIHDLSNNLLQARTLLSFYDDVATLYTIYHDEFDKDELNHFNAVYKEADLKRKAIGNVGTKLTAEWLYPTLEKSQETLPADKRLSKADLERRLRFADQDISSISYWMGSVINGRDPVNAIFAVLVKDKLNQHHGEEAELNATTRRLYDDFLKRTGTPDTTKAYEEYVKKNFLRKAKYWDVVGYDKEKGEAKHAYKEAWAYNEKHYWDLYYDDLRLFKEGLEADGRPATDKQWEEYNQKVTNWIDANHPEISGTHKYDNPLFDKLMADPYYNHLYSTYKTSNAKYGERRLDHGIIQQAYKKANSLAEFKNDIQGLPDYFKKTFTDKTKSAGEKVESVTGDLGTYLFDQREYMREQDLNLDGSYYRGVKSPFTHIINEENLDFRLNESLIGFSQAANDFAALRSIQAETENLKMLMESNPKLGIAGRQIASRDRSGKILFDRFAKRPENEFASKLNKQLISSINDIFYGESEFQAGVNIGPVHLNLNALGKRLGFGTALFTMAGNLFSGISNAAIGNVMSLGEAVGGRYYKPKNWLWAQKEYAVNIGSFAHDVVNPVKSKITQLAIRYDAIQGEFRDKYGKNITGNVINKYATGDTFFILMHATEHQIQLTGMLALMDATKVKLKDGSTVSLYDAYKANDKGFFKLRSDAVWSDQDNVDFMKKLHGISRDLNGNYASYDKSMLQRYWMGKLAMQYRKYLYPAWRARFGGERVDYERRDVQEGYYRTFLKKFWNDMKDYNFNVLQSVPKTIFGKAESEQVAYARRKTAFDVLTMVGVTMLAASLAGLEKQNQDDTDDKAQERLLLTTLRLRSDLSQFTWTLPQEVYRDISNPSASLRLIQTYADVMSQFFTDPTEDYKQNGSGYQRGDNKLGTKLEKAIPLWRQFQRWGNPKDQVKYYNLINKDVKPSNMVSENSK